ncbi:MAG: hypothetical protein ACK5L3_04260 [Oscillospiraceae bacterium]
MGISGCWPWILDKNKGIINNKNIGVLLMNHWTQISIELANQRDYLDQLFHVYPMAANLNRGLDEETQEQLMQAFATRDNKELITLLLRQEIFPIKDSYVAYLKRDRTAIERNPNTIDRIAGSIYSMGYDETLKKMTVPKETNRQIGPLFKNWIRRGSLGVEVTSDMNRFLRFQGNIVFYASDTLMEKFARDRFGYIHDKGLDFIGKFNNIIILAEAKFLTDFGGHQNAQLADALNTMRSHFVEMEFMVKPITILDGVVYIQGGNKMYRTLVNCREDEVIISSLLLRDYLYSI